MLLCVISVGSQVPVERYSSTCWVQVVKGSQECLLCEECLGCPNFAVGIAWGTKLLPAQLELIFAISVCSHGDYPGR